MGTRARSTTDTLTHRLSKCNSLRSSNTTPTLLSNSLRNSNHPPATELTNPSLSHNSHNSRATETPYPPASEPTLSNHPPQSTAASLAAGRGSSSRVLPLRSRVRRRQVCRVVLVLHLLLSSSSSSSIRRINRSSRGCRVAGVMIRGVSIGR